MWLVRGGRRAMSRLASLEGKQNTPKGFPYFTSCAPAGQICFPTDFDTGSRPRAKQSKERRRARARREGMRTNYRVSASFTTSAIDYTAIIASQVNRTQNELANLQANTNTTFLTAGYFSLRIATAHRPANFVLCYFRSRHLHCFAAASTPLTNRLDLYTAPLLSAIDDHH